MSSSAALPRQLRAALLTAALAGLASLTAAHAQATVPLPTAPTGTAPASGSGVAVQGGRAALVYVQPAQIDVRRIALPSLHEGRR